MLEKLIEKKDLLAYIHFRMALLEVNLHCAMKTLPKGEREFIRQRYIGRLKELEKLRVMLENNQVKKTSKKYAKKLKEINEEE